MVVSTPRAQKVWSEAHGRSIHSMLFMILIRCTCTDDKYYSHNDHSAELTNTVRSSGVKPWVFSSTERGLNAKGAWNWTWLSMVKLCRVESWWRIGDTWSERFVRCRPNNEQMTRLTNEKWHQGYPIQWQIFRLQRPHLAKWRPTGNVENTGRHDILGGPW